jgi:hypothetical protein
VYCEFFKQLKRRLLIQLHTREVFSGQLNAAFWISLVRKTRK